MYSTAFWLFVVLLVFLVLLRNHCYSMKGVTVVTQESQKKQTVKRQTDTKMQWNTSKISLFYSFHLRKIKV